MTSGSSATTSHTQIRRPHSKVRQNEEYSDLTVSRVSSVPSTRPMSKTRSVTETDSWSEPILGPTRMGDSSTMAGLPFLDGAITASTAPCRLCLRSMAALRYPRRAGGICCPTTPPIPPAVRSAGRSGLPTGSAVAGRISTTVARFPSNSMRYTIGSARWARVPRHWSSTRGRRAAVTRRSWCTPTAPADRSGGIPRRALCPTSHHRAWSTGVTACTS
ncbi:hypothetical protein DFR68_104196 [Nocardia mexicana]|uniref:Uncharacterized protein n=1 Tax=Nocardia mexicana TaxID=279262 RepID=A0A370H5P7_9NOCA|nr:hypothetical protein DFR68_104196 [Nocardia mexicana]